MEKHNKVNKHFAETEQNKKRYFNLQLFYINVFVL